MVCVVRARFSWRSQWLACPHMRAAILHHVLVSKFDASSIPPARREALLRRTALPESASELIMHLQSFSGSEFSESRRARLSFQLLAALAGALATPCPCAARHASANSARQALHVEVAIRAARAVWPADSALCAGLTGLELCLTRD
jgi:hypothetical protein